MPQGSIKELIIFKMNPFVVPFNSDKLKSAFFAFALSSEYFTRTSLYLVRLKYFHGLHFLEDVQIKFRETELRCFNCLVYEFTATHPYKNAEMSLKSTTTDGFNFRIINSLMES